MEEYSLIVLIDCWTSFEGVFINKCSHCWFARDVMVAMSDDTNKSVSLLWELNPISYKFLKKNSIVLSSNMTALSHGCKPRILSALIVIRASILISTPVLSFLGSSYFYCSSTNGNATLQKLWS